MYVVARITIEWFTYSMYNNTNNMQSKMCISYDCKLKCISGMKPTPTNNNNMYLFHTNGKSWVGISCRPGGTPGPPGVWL